MRTRIRFKLTYSLHSNGQYIYMYLHMIEYYRREKLFLSIGYNMMSDSKQVNRKINRDNY